MKRFGRLTTDEISIKKGKAYFYKCICDCGNITTPERNALFSGRVVSCGCYAKEKLLERTVTHNLWGTKTYWAWAQAKQRCTNNTSQDFENYGGRGINFDTKWNSFEEFYGDMGECPEGMTLDRIDVNGNYCKDNCRWTNNSMQSFNTRKQTNNTSGRTGVSYLKSKGKWRAYINVKGKQIYLGLFLDYEKACKARTEAEVKYFGEIKL